MVFNVRYNPRGLPLGPPLADTSRPGMCGCHRPQTIPDRSRAGTEATRTRATSAMLYALPKGLQGPTNKHWWNIVKQSCDANVLMSVSLFNQTKV